MYVYIYKKIEVQQGQGQHTLKSIGIKSKNNVPTIKKPRDFSKSSYYKILELKRKTKGVNKNMRLVINEKVFDSKEFKGTEAELLEQFVYEFLNINSVVMMERLAVVYEMLIGYIKDVLEIQEDPPFNFDDIERDREKLEIVIEQYKFAKFLSSRYKGSYESYLDQLEQYEVFSKDKAIMTLIDYKLARFGNEIFKEMGIKIVDRIDKGFIVIDNSKYIN